MRQLLSPWVVEYASAEDADVVIVYKTAEEVEKATVLVPSGRQELDRLPKEVSARNSRKDDEVLRVQATDRLLITSGMLDGRPYATLIEGRIDDSVSPRKLTDTTTVKLPVDIISVYALKMGEMLCPRISGVFRFMTGLPVPYTWAPEGLRNLILGVSKETINEPFLDHLDLDALRYLLVWGIQEATGKELPKKMWNNHRCFCCVTHDVETRDGLRRALAMKKMEERYDIPSTWFLPTERYELNRDKVLALGNFGEIGSHDTRHDGKLLGLSEEKTTNRLRGAKTTLEGILGNDIMGFRAPLLQHSEMILKCLSEAGYAYDSSVPSWEPKHPSCMGPYGIGTVYPLYLDGIMELPVSVPQDHQMIHVNRFSARKTVQDWLVMKEIIKDLAGICTILVHPDYELSTQEGLVDYEEALNSLAADNSTQMTTPKKIVHNRGLTQDAN